VDSEERPATDSVVAIESILAQAQRYGFFAAVTLLERLTPDAPRIGGLGPAADEAVHFHHDPSLSFPTSDVSSVKKVQKGDPNNTLGPKRTVYDITCTFLGLTGAASPMPSYFIEEVLHEDPDYPAQREFLDIFHHRILSLFYRWRSSTTSRASTSRTRRTAGPSACWPSPASTRSRTSRPSSTSGPGSSCAWRRCWPTARAPRTC